MTTVTRRRRLCGWSIRSTSVALALLLCASAFADPSKNVVVPPTRQVAQSLLREEHSFWHSSAMRSVWDQSDHRQSDRNNRARDREIITLTQPFRRKAHVSALELGEIGLWLAILPLALPY